MTGFRISGSWINPTRIQLKFSGNPMKQKTSSVNECKVGDNSLLLPEIYNVYYIGCLRFFIVFPSFIFQLSCSSKVRLVVICYSIDRYKEAWDCMSFNFKEGPRKPKHNLNKQAAHAYSIENSLCHSFVVFI